MKVRNQTERNKAASANITQEQARKLLEAAKLLLDTATLDYYAWRDLEELIQEIEGE